MNKIYPQYQPQRRLINDMPPSQRPLYRMNDIGVQALSTAELLSILLCRADGLDFAQDLLAHCENVGGLSHTTREHLMLFPGIGENKSAQILASIELGRRSFLPSGNNPAKITTPQDAVCLLAPRIGYEMQENFAVMLLDTRNVVIDLQILYVGSLNTAVIRVAEVFRLAIVKYACAMIVAHNHPSGDPSPSPQDISITKSLSEMGNKLDIEVLDHIIIGHNGRFCSLKERGHLI